MENKVGFGFRPTDDELVGFFLINKIQGNTALVQSINEVNICNFDPWELPLQSKIKSRDLVWYFFSRKENKHASGNRQSRTTISGSGFWKLTGESVDVKDKWGLWRGIPGTIGLKRVLGFHRKGSIYSSKGKKSDWVMHEYHDTLLPEHMRTYVICRLEYKGDDRNMLTENAIEPTPNFVPKVTYSADSVIDHSFQGNSGSYNTFSEYDSANQGQHLYENFNMQPSIQGNSGTYNIFSEYDLPNQGQQFSGNFTIQQPVQGNLEPSNNFLEYDLPNQGQWSTDYFNMHQHAPNSDPYEVNESDIWKQVVEENIEFLVDERTFMQENFNEHRPKKPVTGIVAEDSSDSDSDSDSTNAWSSTDSVGSSNEPYNTPKDIPLLIQPYELPKQQLQSEKVINKQKSECKMAENLNKKTSITNRKWIVLEKISLKNIIIGFLLFISIISWIIG